MSRNFNRAPARHQQDPRRRGAVVLPVALVAMLGAGCGILGSSDPGDTLTVVDGGRVDVFSTTLGEDSGPQPPPKAQLIGGLSVTAVCETPVTGAETPTVPITRQFVLVKDRKGALPIIGPDMGVIQWSTPETDFTGDADGIFKGLPICYITPGTETIKPPESSPTPTTTLPPG